MAFTMSNYIRTCAAYTLFLELLLISSFAMAESAEEKQKCAEKLGEASPCLPYLQGDAKAPTSDCCNGLNAIKNNHKCLCLMLKDLNDPDLGFKINITLALGLPSICQVPENLSQCPALLHLDPNSPEAQVYNQVKRNFTSAGSPTSGPPAETFPEGKRTGASVKSEACYSSNIKLVPEILLAWLLIWPF